MQQQLNHNQFKQTQHQFKNKIIYVLENLEHPENIGSAFRLADGFNIEGIIIISNAKLDTQKIEKTARNTQKHVPYKIVETASEAVKLIKETGYIPFNVEITTASVPLRDVDFSNFEKVALIVGNERLGVSEEMLSLVPNSVHIEMYGVNSSLNVSTALAIATYHVSETNVLKKNCEIKGDI